MKKYIIVSLLVSVCIIFAGCGSENNKNNDQESVKFQASKNESSSIQASVQESSVIQESVQESTIESIYITPDSCTITTGETRKLNVQSENGLENASDYIWESYDKSIVDVNDDGYITGVSEGLSTITVSSKKKVGLSEKVTVIVKETNKSSFEPDESMYIQESENLNANNKNFYSYSNYDDAYYAYEQIGNVLYDDDVYSLTQDDIQLLINTIYAKNGYIFKTGYIQNFFESQSWYYNLSDKTTDKYGVEKRFSSMDKQNIELLNKYR